MGVFSASPDEHYQYTVSKGIEGAFKKSSISLIYFLGERIDSPQVLDQQSNFLYDLAREAELDGIIGITGSLSTFASIEYIRDFYSSFPQNIPTISIGGAVPGIPSLVSDNARSIEQIVTHLIEDHGRRNIAFLSGPDKHQEAQDRLSGYKQALIKHQLPYNEALVVKNGNFLSSSGAEAMVKILEKKVSFDGVIGANDDMALGALNVLLEKGYRVPEDISLCGYDNSEESRLNEPKLTTVAQPCYLMGHEAAQAMINWIDEGQMPDNLILLESELFLRRSCGCLNHSSEDSFTRQILDYWHDRVDLSLTSRNLIKITLEMTSSSLSLVEVKDLFSQLEHLLIDYWKLSDIPFDLYSLNDLLDDLLKRYHSGNYQVLSDYLKCWMRQVNQAHHKNLIKRLEVNQTNISNLLSTTSELLTSFDFPCLYAILDDQLSKLMIDELYIVKAISQTQSQLIYVHETNNTLGASYINQLFDSTKLLPPEMINRSMTHPLVVMSLFHGTSHFGYVVYLKKEHIPVSNLLAVTQQLRSAINSIQFIQHKEDFRMVLEKKVQERTKELKYLNDQLRQEINRNKDLQALTLQITDRERRLFGQELHDDICQRMGGVSMLTQVLGRTLAKQDNKLADDALRISQLMDETLDITRKVSHSLFPTVLSESGLQYGIEELCQKVSIQYGIPVVTKFYQEDISPRLNESDCLNLYRITQEALQNAIKHSHSQSILVEISETEFHIKLSISDDGCGFETKSIKNIQGIGFHSMRHRAEALGAYLHIHSQEGEGTIITCIKPKGEPYEHLFQSN
ncbi:substrate-binding domain-containing protein [Spirochaeta cellobiosiphila]|uniref:substrate-binding domain-containing protein n=1 Tax=Spirochaeta cellobiosiphila TaxID=504483 RepID=UPI00048BB7A4|nr:substrate-binding domain-containing protein [Spirochaeta cellobiosiphila]